MGLWPQLFERWINNTIGFCNTHLSTGWWFTRLIALSTCWTTGAWSYCDIDSHSVTGFSSFFLFYSLSRQLEDLKQFVFILLIFIIAYGIALQAVSFPGPGKFQRGFWEVLRGIVDLPYWQMYGELFLEEISGNCPWCWRSGTGGGEVGVRGARRG